MTGREEVALPATLTADLRARWLALVDIAVWGDLKSEQLGLLGRMRKRILELGERLKSLDADRAWIPIRRERIKNLLGSCLSAREALLLAERAAQGVTGGGDADALSQAFVDLHRIVTVELARHENTWAETLQALNKGSLQDAGDE
ncbi:hypothetical protein [Acidiferrobacter sp.]|uniref:hypothetical protein n=1 Tax=Acidiferrobacter sp. TaxID=1872107 RepID=UPI00261F0612|nr:hypothetical protein [Acidiferrobacter sp.]